MKHFMCIFPDNQQVAIDLPSADARLSLNTVALHAAEKAIEKLGLITPRKDPQTIEIVVHELQIAHGHIERSKTPVRVKLQPPLSRMTDEEYKDELAKLLAILPGPFREFVTSWAWDHGHAYGYEEVISIASEMVTGLKSAIDQHAARF